MPVRTCACMSTRMPAHMSGCIHPHIGTHVYMNIRTQVCTDVKLTDALPQRTCRYKEDLFGLKTADDAGKNFFESFNGNVRTHTCTRMRARIQMQHIRMTKAELFAWLDKYFRD